MFCTVKACSVWLFTASDTVEVQDSVVLPSGAEVPVARSTQSAALPLGMAPLGIQAAPLGK